MTDAITQSNIARALEWGYEKAVNGMPGFGTAEELAADYLKGDALLIDKVNTLIRWQNAKAATSGFVNGLGGVALMPITLPVGFTSVLYMQLRLIAAIAHMGGHDIRDDRVKTLAYLCLCGNGAKDVLKDVGIAVSSRLGERAVRGLPGAALRQLNKAVGFRLATKFGRTGALNLGKCLPLVGGLIGATLDGVSTDLIGNVARDTFIAA